MAWRVTSDVRLSFAIVYPLILQVAHPTVDAGVTDYSDFDRKPWERLLRTMDYVSMLVYGGREAVAVGRRLRELHKHFRGTRADGTRYSALEPDAYAWVHATLLDTYVRGHAHFGTPLSAADTERFYAEYRGLGRLIGVRERDLPETWPQFCAYFRRTARTTLTRTASVGRVLDTIGQFDAPSTPISGRLWPAIKIPIRRAVWLCGVGLLEPVLRRRLGVRWSPIDDAQLRVLGVVLRGIGPVMPETWKVSGPGHLRWRSAEIEAGPLGRAA